MGKFVQIALFFIARILKAGRVAARGHHEIEVDADQPLRMGVAEATGDTRSPVAACAPNRA